jgi:hypothetical protein
VDTHSKWSEPLDLTERTIGVPKRPRLSDRYLGVLLWAAPTLFTAPTVAAQQAASGGGWNDANVVSLIGRARERRASVAVDPEFRSYKAEARGYVYFFVDRPDSSATKVLVKADQVALELYFQAPGTARQRIVGTRDEEILPTDVRYHMDHVTVVQDDFGDYIRMGDGDEVAQVVHPVGPRAEDFYDFLLSDSLSLTYAAGQEEVRVYEIRVRPKDLNQPGFVGTVFLDRDRAAIVRMNFSFTPASYVDPYLDYIRVSLNHSLWDGSWWLPYKQEVEIRREMPVFDFLAGSIIRSRFDVRGYDFNVEVPDAVLNGPKVGSLPPSQRRAFVFERGLFDDLEETGGLRPSPSIQEVQTQVREVVEDHVLSGLSPVRLHLSGISDFARYNRAEGIFAGGGLTLRPRGDITARGTGGYAFGRKRGSGALRVSTEAGGVVPTLEAYWDVIGDIGRHPGATPLENTITSSSGSRDYLDPFFRRGATITFASAPSGPVGVSLRWEEHVSARDVVSDGPDTQFRPVRSITEGTMASLQVRARTGLPGEGEGEFTLVGGRLGERSFASAVGDARWAVADAEERWSAEISASGGLTNPGAPAQTMFLLGGRHTLPGHDYRLFAGNAYWLVRTEGTVPIRPPWLGVRAFAVLGSTYLAEGTSLPADWLARDSRGLRGSVGLGLSVGWDAMRIDLGRAVWGSGWEAVFSVAPQFRSWL